jgi:hypothetical protein
MCAESQNQSLPPDSVAAPAELPESHLESSAPEERKRTKHTRVHKREKELFGLVTPIFLPLLEAGDPTPTKKKEKKRRHREKGDSSGTSPPASEQGSPPRDASKGKEPSSHSSEGSEKMEQDEALHASIVKEKQAAESRKKSKRPVMKKSSLRKNSNGERSRRKRVSLVIDDQIVLPADEYQEPPLSSPSETTISSNSTSTTSLDDVIDPRLLPQQETHMHEQVEHYQHQDAVHHSLPYPTHNPTTSPSKQPDPFLSDSPLSQSPPRSPIATALYDPQPSENRTFRDVAPVGVSIPKHASSTPIYASQPEVAEQGEEEFSTYVGGPSGSGADDLDQTGSLGYPSSLGASYMESYMQSRPLSVRMAAAEKAGLDEEEKELLLSGRGGVQQFGSEESRAADADVREASRGDDDDEMDVIGSMEGF